MKVLFDHQAFDMQTHGGISRSFVELYRNMPQCCNVKVAVRETDNIYLNQLGFKRNGHRMHHFIVDADFPGKFFLFRVYNRLLHLGYGMDYNRRYTLRLMADGDYDVFHPTFFSPYFLPHLNGKPFVLTVHDMTPEHHPEFYPSDYPEMVNKRALIHKAAAIVAVSENTKRDILRFFPDIDPERITVVYHGPSFDQALMPSKQVSDMAYILYVGHRWKYKNFGLFVKHLSPFLRRHRDIKVVCTGESFYPFERELMEGLGVEQQFVSTFVRTDQEFIDLYHNALAFVYPSASEGFGMPVLEAFQGRTVALINNASCFPEIGGDSCLYFDIDDDASDLSDMAERVYALSAAERTSIIDSQLQRLKRFSWQESTERLASLYQSLK